MLRKKVVGYCVSTLFALLLLLIFCINNTYAGDIKIFDKYAKSDGYIYKGEIERGWHSYNSKRIAVFVRVNEDGNIVEGFLNAKPTSDDNMINALSNIYGALASSLNMDSMNIVPNTKSIFNKVRVGLRNSNKCEFNYNEHIGVRGQIIGVSRDEKSQGKEPTLIIKLWAYK